MIRQILTTLIVLVVFLTPVVAQQSEESITIHGKICDSNGVPIPGATVVVKGNHAIGTVANVAGEYSLTAPTEAVIIVSFLGYEEATIRLINHRTTYDITLYEASRRLNDVVIVGYGEVKKSDLTGSVSVIGERSFYDQPVKNIADILQGRTSGVEVTNSSGAPGSAAKIRVRGTTSINKSSDPLYVIDGIISTSGLNGINPDDIASMQILKDASSTAVYGSRGANGVVLITTRSGEEGISRIIFDSKVGISDVRKNYNLLNPYEYALALNDIRGAGTISDDDMALYKSGEKGIDWVDQLTRTAVTQDYNLSMSGGNNKVRYMISGNVLDQEAITIRHKYMRYGL